MKPTALTINKVQKKFGNSEVLKDISMSLHKGDIGSLVGISGSGKTTLMRIIAGLEQQESGSIFIQGKDCSSLAPQRRGVGLIFQDYALFPHLTVQQNITFGLQHQSRKSKVETVTRMLQLVQLQGMENRYPHQLSGGQQQRIAIVRALAPAPAVVLFDEPFSNLDPIQKRDLRGQIQSLIKATKASALIVTHDIDDAMQISDQITILEKGTVVQSGTPQSLIQSPKTQHVANLLQREKL